MEAGTNEAFWLRLHVPKNAKPGAWRGSLRLLGGGIAAEVPVVLTVYGFSLPDRMTCATAFGFSPGEVFRYQNLKTEADKRLVLEKYWANFAAHHISPYDPAPLDRIKVTWPDVKPPERKWQGGVEVKNEKHSGQQSLLLYDNDPKATTTALYKGRISIPKGGLRLRLWYRTAVPAL